MAGVAAWVKEQVRPLFGNAVAERDRRVQLRGAKSVLLWSAYVLVFILVATFAYSAFVTNAYSYSAGVGGSQGDHTLSVLSAQRQLKTFYDTIFNVLGGVVSLIAPVMGASSIVAERQKRLLDLVLSSPVTPGYYVIGKLASCYRYIWLLLLLALPMVSVGVVMGGASWWEVAGSFLTISLSGLVLAAIGVAVSANSQKVVGAVVTSLVLAFATVGLEFGVSASYTFTRFMGRSNEMPVLGTLSPFGATQVVSSVTNIGAVPVPNVILVVPLTLLIVAVLVMAAASALQTRHTRIVTVYRATLAVLAAVGGVVAAGSSPTSPANIIQTAGGFVFFYAFVIPYISCYGAGDPAKYLYDGAPKVRNTFRAAPSGALSYVLLLPVLFFGGVVAGRAGHMDAEGWQALALSGGGTLSLCFAMWGLSRVTSRLGTSIRISQGLSLLTSLITAFLFLLVSATQPYNTGVPMTPFVLLAGGQEMVGAKIGWAVVLFVVGGVLAFVEPAVNKARWAHI